jgi:nitrile hydratase
MLRVLLSDLWCGFAARAAALEFGMQTSNQNAVTILRVVANTPSVHNVIVCTLCSCYPIGLLGFSPSWYKSRAYRSRVVREPRKVLAEFGLELPATTSIRVHDSTADCRYFVLPLPPAHLTQEAINTMSHEELKKLVTRDSMIGVAVL